MSMHVGAGRSGPVSEINVTPLIDVMLVLLIITMLVAPLLNDRTVRLPQAEHTQARPETGRQTIVHLTASRELYVDNVAVGPADLVARLGQALDAKVERVVYLKADRDAPYSAVMTVMDQLHAAHIENVGLITETPMPRSAAGHEGL
jgi:biopolymer transport protein TolR